MQPKAIYCYREISALEIFPIPDNDCFIIPINVLKPDVANLTLSHCTHDSELNKLPHWNLLLWLLSPIRPQAFNLLVARYPISLIAAGLMPRM
jgi:hypothetical protein